MMKLILVLAFVGAALAGEAIDWSKVKPITSFPSFWARYPNLQRYQSSRVVGGQEATPHQFPYQTALFVEMAGGTAFCGASLISPEYVLTAAHCTDDASSFQVILGAHLVRSQEDTQRIFDVSKANVKVHENWRGNFEYDLAVIRLPERVQLTDAIQTISLPPWSAASNTFVDADATVSGWGLASDGSTTISPHVRFVTNSLITNLLCNIRYLGQIKSSHVCLSGSGGKSSCSGDSGGPLTVHLSNGKLVQVGIVSFGISLGCEIGWPSVYTRTTSYLDWIEKNTDVKIDA